MQLHSRRRHADIGPQRLRARHVGADAQVGVQHAAPLFQLHVDLVLTVAVLGHDRQQPAFPRRRRADAHRDAHRRAVRAVHPRVIRHRERQRQRLLGVQVLLDHAPVEGLAQAVGGDEAEAFHPPGAHLLRRLVPPVHDEIGALRHLGPRRPQRLRVAVAQRQPHRPGANERRIPHDELRLRPLGLTRIHVTPLRHLRRLVRHLFARHRMHLGRLAIPARDRAPVRVRRQFLPVVGQHRIPARDVAVVVHHRLGDALLAAGADLPLQPADPQHQLGQRRRARVQLDAEHLAQRDRAALHPELPLRRLAQRLQPVEHLALQPLQVFQRHVQEIAAAAGRIEHPHMAEPVMEAPQLGARLGQLVLALPAVERVGLARQHQRRAQRVLPLGAQRLDHRRHHQPLHIRPRRVVRPQRVALARIERALQQRAEDRRLHLAPVRPRRAQQAVDLRGRQRQHIARLPGALEQLAVEAHQVLRQHRAEAAAVHRRPQRLQHLAQPRRLVTPARQQPDEGASPVVVTRQQPDILREHREQAARQEGGDQLGRMPGLLQAARQLRQLGRHRPRHPRADARRVERHRIEPQCAQPLADLRAVQVVEPDAVRAHVGVGRVGTARAAELGVQLDDMADIDHRDEGRAPFGGGQRAHIALGLRQRLQQCVVEALARAPRRGRLRARIELLRLQHEAAAAIAVDAPRAARAVAMHQRQRALEHVVLLGGRVRAWHAEQLAQLDGETLRRRQLRGCRAAPAGDESLDVGRGRSGTDAAAAVVHSVSLVMIRSASRAS